MNEQTSLFDENPEYAAFVGKFKPKKTTDDCYTPPLVYDAIRDWACREYGIDPACIVRPFYPGGDYEHFDYPAGCVVLDNPPFSILSKICEFYLAHNIPFFLFAPSRTALSSRATVMRINHIFCDANIEYENGAIVRTSFVTSFGGDVVAQTAPELTRIVNHAVEVVHSRKGASLPKYEYPDHVVTAAMLQKYSKYGVDWKIRKEDCFPVSKLDAQKEHGKKIFGCGLLLSERQAEKHAGVKRAAAERAAAVVWSLSPRERDIVKALGGGGGRRGG